MPLLLVRLEREARPASDGGAGGFGYCVTARLDDGGRSSPQTDGPFSLENPEPSLRAALQGGDPAKYGRALGEWLWAPRLRELLHAGLQRSRDEGRLPVFLSIEESAAELRGWHWEQLQAPLDGGWTPLATGGRTTFALVVPRKGGQSQVPVRRRELKSLLAVSRPWNLSDEGFTDFDPDSFLPGVASELREFCAPPVALGWGEAPGSWTLADLKQRLTQAPFFLLHLVCHGTPEGLVLMTESGEVRFAPHDELLQALRTPDGHLPALVFLSACYGASPQAEQMKREGGQPPGSLARKLVEAGVTAVAAMADWIGVPTAAKLVGPFYQSLLKHGRPDLALADALTTAFQRPDELVPTLFTSIEQERDLAIFDPRETAVELAYREERGRHPAQGFERPWLRPQVDDFLKPIREGQAEAPRYLQLVAGPFFGKSYIAESLARLPELGGCPPVYHFYRRTTASALRNPEEGLGSLCEQLRRHHGMEPALQPEKTLGDLEQVLRKISGTLAGTGKAQLIILDGLDEAFGPRGALEGGQLDSWLPRPEWLRGVPGVAFFLTTRPETQLSWQRRPEHCRTVTAPSHEELISEVAQALPGLNQEAKLGYAPAPAWLLPHFATASAGLLGLSWQFHLKRPEKWAGWQADPTTLKTGVVGTLMQLWEEPMLGAKREGIQVAAYRAVMSLLALAAEPLRPELLDALLEAAESSGTQTHRPRSVADPASLKLETIAEVARLGRQLFRPAAEVGSRLSFVHESLAQMIRGELAEAKSDTVPLPNAAELDYWSAVLASACECAWQQSGSPAREYALRHVALHLAKVGQRDRLYAAARNPVLLEAQSQLDAFLPLATLRLAFDDACQAEPLDAGVVAEFALARAVRAERLRAEETPLKALQQGGPGSLERAWQLAELFPDGTDRTLNFLTLAHTLGRQDRWDELDATLRHLEPHVMPLHGWRWNAAAELLAELAGWRLEWVCRSGCRFVERDQDRVLLCERLIEKGWLDQSREIAATILSARYREQACVEIATAFAQAGQLDGIRVLVQDISDERVRVRVETLAGVVASAFSQAGQLDESLKLVEGISDEWDRARPLSGIAMALAQDGQLDESLKLIEGISDKWVRVKALSCVATAFAQAGRFDEVRALFSDGHSWSEAVPRFAAALAQAGLFDTIRVLLGDIRIGRIDLRAPALKVAAFAEMGLLEESRALIEGISERWERDDALQACAAAFARVGRLNEIRVLAGGTVDHRLLEPVLPFVTVALAQANQYDQSHALAEGISHELYRAQALSGIAVTFAPADRMDELRALVEGIGDEPRRMAALAGLAVALALAGRLDEIRALVEGINDDRVRVKVLKGIAVAFAWAGRLDEIRVLAESIGDARYQTSALSDIVGAFVHAGRLDDVRAFGGAIWAETHAQQELAAALALAEAGRWREIRALVEGIRDEPIRVHILASIAAAFARAGRLDEIRTLAAGINDYNVRGWLFAHIAKTTVADCPEFAMQIAQGILVERMWRFFDIAEAALQSGKKKVVLGLTGLASGSVPETLAMLCALVRGWPEAAERIAQLVLQAQRSWMPNTRPEVAHQP